MSSGEPRANRDVAVIDVGSNSVRLVLYRLEGPRHLANLQ